MKAHFLLLSFLLFGLIAKGQGVVVQGQSECTVAGSQHGATIQFESRTLWGLGIFYQAELGNGHETYIPKDTFLGMLVQAPLATAKRISFFAMLRAGFVNENFVVLVPGLETRVHISPRFGTAFGMSMRMGYAAVSGKLFVKVF
ncbi:MAG TPA: hypothetical protein VIH22_07220 [Cyclobacteriaceae bacterium]